MIHALAHYGLATGAIALVFIAAVIFLLICVPFKNK
jgi:hypothetical protein